MSRKYGSDIKIVEETYHNIDKNIDSTNYRIYLREDYISEATYKELIEIRNIINRIEREKKGGRK